MFGTKGRLSKLTKICDVVMAVAVAVASKVHEYWSVNDRGLLDRND